MPTNSSLEDVFRLIDAGVDAAVEEIMAYCRLPTVSAQGLAIDETARYTADLLRAEGFDVSVLSKPEGGFPVVYGEQRGAGTRTLLFYNHYDVQPPDPLDEWTSPPFERKACQK